MDKDNLIEMLGLALINANEQLEAWRTAFSSYADSEEVAVQIDNAIEAYETYSSKQP